MTRLPNGCFVENKEGNQVPVSSLRTYKSAPRFCLINRDRKEIKRKKTNDIFNRA